MKGKKNHLRHLWWCVLFLLAIVPTAGQVSAHDESVVLIVTDGLRWQEVFHGADVALLDKEHGHVEDPQQIRRDFWRPNEEQRRRALMPFLWNVIAKQGQIFGNVDQGSRARVTNGLKFSYPGYNEMLTGKPDARIDSNDFGPNPNLTVFEWLNRQQELSGKVAAFGTWDAFSRIFNRARCGFPVQAGWELPAEGESDPELIRLYQTTTRTWNDLVYDSFLQSSVIDYLKKHDPRVMFVGYGETDEYAHQGRYDQVLWSVRRVDAFVEELWNALQSIPAYRNKTSIVLTTDHGRGSGLTEWRNHGRNVDGAEDIWIAALGPHTAPLGVGVKHISVTQSQIAGTVAALIGYDFSKSGTNPAPAIFQITEK